MLLVVNVKGFYIELIVILVIREKKWGLKYAYDKDQFILYQMRKKLKVKLKLTNNY